MLSGSSRIAAWWGRLSKVSRFPAMAASRAWSSSSGVANGPFELEPAGIIRWSDIREFSMDLRLLRWLVARWDALIAHSRRCHPCGLEQQLARPPRHRPGHRIEIPGWK